MTVMTVIILLMLVSAALPSVRHLWVSGSVSSVKDLVVQWETAAASSVLPVTQFAVQLRPETRPSTCSWTRVTGFTTSTVIKGTAASTNIHLKLSNYS